MRTKSVVAIAAAVLILGGAIAGFSMSTSLKKYKQKVAAIQIENVDLTKVPDGSYTGSCDVEFVKAKVLVTVKDHRFDSIELLEHKNGKGGDAEILPTKVIEAQSLQVDSITGATASSKVILKAIENAIENAPSL